VDGQSGGGGGVGGGGGNFGGGGGGGGGGVVLCVVVVILPVLVCEWRMMVPAVVYVYYSRCPNLERFRPISVLEA